MTFLQVRRSSGSRTGRLAAITMASLLVLTGCGDSDAAGGASDSGSTGASASADAGAFPVTIEHKYGSTTIEDEPERVLTVGLTDQDAVLALGVVPVATTEWFGEQPGGIWPWATDRLEELGGKVPESLGTSDTINYEKIAAQRPDLILSLYSGLTQEQYDKLAAIAPVVAQPDGDVDYGISWDVQTLTIGTALGREDEAEQLVADTRAAIEAAKTDHPEFQGRTAVVATPYEGIFVYGPEDPRGRFLTSLGFQLPEGLVEATGEEFGGNLSMERADMLDVDLIIWLDPEDAESELGGPLYSTFAVHTEGREVNLDSFDDPLGAATSFVTPLSLPYLIDGILPKLTAAVDGDPATKVP